MRGSTKPKKVMGRASAMQFVKVRPFTMPVVNFAWKNAATALTCAANTIKLYVYFVEKRYGLPDSTHYLPGSKPRFLQPACTSRDDPGAVKDAACGKSCAVEEASTEAPAAPRRSDKPKLEGLAAVTEQADCGICTSWPACSSRKK